jgi:hypothetical protein
MKITMAHKFSNNVKSGNADPSKLAANEGSLLTDYVTFSDGSVYKISTAEVVEI